MHRKMAQEEQHLWELGWGLAQVMENLWAEAWGVELVGEWEEERAKAWAGVFKIDIRSEQEIG